MAAGRGKDSGRKGNEKVKGQRLKALQRHDMLQYMEVFISGLLFFLSIFEQFRCQMHCVTEEKNLLATVYVKIFS